MWKYVVLFSALFVDYSVGFADVGKWDLPVNGESCGLTLIKSLFVGSKIIARLHCDVTQPTNVKIVYKWYAVYCSPNYDNYIDDKMQCTTENNPSLFSKFNNMSSVITQTCNDKDTITLFTDDDVKDTKASSYAVVEHEGVYGVDIAIESKPGLAGSFHIEMNSPHGYLSAAIWPLLPFFGVMCAVYTILCASWLIVCGLQWRDLLRIQYWIGGVALLGMIESSTYYAVYSAINNSGYFSSGAYMFAEFTSVSKRALARMLVIIVSLGFGIVKPRLGPALQRVVATGLLWGVLATIEAYLRLHRDQENSNKHILLAETPLSLLDSAICWWVFVSLSHTMRTLQLRRNAIKLSLYRHFTNTLIFAVLSSVVFMLYAIKTYRMSFCIQDWKEVWIDAAYWHILFVSILTVIMILWRPTNNNQRYAFTPLLDNAEDDDDEEDQFINDAYGVKMRSTSISAESPSSNPNAAKDSTQPENRNSLEADLKWVEENIPTSTLPLLDSDEEIINTKFEVSKMQ